MNEALCVETDTANVLSGSPSIMPITGTIVLVNVLVAASDNRGVYLCETCTEFDGRLCERILRNHGSGLKTFFSAFISTKLNRGIMCEFAICAFHH